MLSPSNLGHMCYLCAKKVQYISISNLALAGENQGSQNYCPPQGDIETLYSSQLRNGGPALDRFISNAVLRIMAESHAFYQSNLQNYKYL